ncbi:melatonin receptor type 1B-like [Mytilus californianus]|uniref:melatonin receptor type 1B-like n=1 Tax=Mytilus californianus TaxID=6549 RepID=UPI002247B671|nr:melatonin receptor type 1B-like [Mytilus californianus]
MEFYLTYTPTTLSKEELLTIIIKSTVDYRSKGTKKVTKDCINYFFSGKVEGRTFFLQYPILCEIIGKMCIISCISSLGSISFLSLNRYILICHNSYYEKIFTWRSCIMMCLSMYVVGVIMVLLNSAGIGEHSFDDKSLECIWDRMATYSYTVVFSVCLVWIPLIVVGMSYLRLFFYVRNKRKQVVSRENGPNIDNKSLRLAKTIFIAYAMFSTCWMPFAMLLVADADDTFPHEVHLFITVFAHLHPSINWLIYYYTNGNFKAGFHKIFRICSRRYKAQRDGQVSQSGTTTTRVINIKSVPSEDWIIHNTCEHFKIINNTKVVLYSIIFRRHNLRKQSTTPVDI